MTTSTTSPRTLNPFGELVLGVIASQGALALVHPINTFKTLCISEKKSPRETFNTLFRQKGEPAWKGAHHLYRGLAGSTLSVVPATAISFGARRLYLDFDDHRFRATLFAALAGAIPATLFDRVVIVQQVSQKKLPLVATFKDILATEGAKSFGRGFTATLVREIIFNGALFEGRDEVLRGMPSFLPFQKMKEITASFVTGFGVGAVTIVPDGIKTLMQNPNGSTSVIQTARGVVETKGVKGLFTGGAIRGLFVGLALTIIVEGKTELPAHLPQFLFKA